MMNIRGMYLRPGNLYKDFEVIKIQRIIQNGTPVEKAEQTGMIIRGCLCESTPEEKLRWNQLQHPITHSITQAGSPKAQSGWVVKRNGKAYQIQGVDSCGDLGVATIYYVEERSDTIG